MSEKYTYNRMLFDSRFYFILSSEFNAYLKQIKVIFSAEKKNIVFFTSDEYDLYFFTAANRGYFENQF